MHKMLLELPSELETERLIVRPYREGDGAAYLQVCLDNREHLLPYEADNPALDVKTLEQAEILVRQFAAEWVMRNSFFFGAWEKGNGAFAAQIYLGVVNWDLPEFEVGYFADRAHEGQGFVTEAVMAVLGFAFDHLHARRVSLRCDSGNVRSYRVAERCGFVCEGHLRQNNFHAPHNAALPGDGLVYGMLLEDYRPGR